jgi:hypothetical protein
MTASMKTALTILVAAGLVSGCKKNSAVDDLFEAPPVDTVVVEVPEDLQVTITTPNTNGKNVGYQVYMAGGCTVPGATVEFRGDATGFTACQANNTWEANVDVSTAAVGTVTVNAYLVEDDNESAVAVRTLNKTSADCDTSAARAAVFAAGDGVGTPYSICTAAQLNNIRYNVTSDFVLRNDVDLQSTAFTPIPNTFSGELDGDNFTIKRLYVYDLSANDVGFFRGIRDGAIIKDLYFESANVTGPSVVGIVAARILGTGASLDNVDVVSGQVAATADYIGGLVAHVNAAATLSIVNSSVTLSSFTGRNYGGGILGSSAAAAGAITLNTVSSSGPITMSNGYAGGIAGYMPSAGVSIANATSSSDVTVNGGVADNYAGGIAALLGTSANIDTCSSSGRITATGNYVGGVVAYFSGAKIWRCAVTGAIQADSSARAISYVGGLVGYATASTTDIYQSSAEVQITITGVNVGNYIGGLGGRIFGGNVIESHATGDSSLSNPGAITIDTGDDATTGSSQIGGAFGRIDIANGATLTITDSSADVDISVDGHNTDVYVGGYVGYLVTPDGASASLADISDSSASGDIEAHNRRIGGWAGTIYVSRSGSRVSLTDVSASGHLTVISQNNITPHYIGGLVGLADSRDAGDVETSPIGHVWNNVSATGNVSVDSGAVGGNYVGGLAGYFFSGRTTAGGSNSVVSHAYATGTVQATSTSTAFSYVGGLFGRVHAANTATVTINSTGGQTYAIGNVTADGLNVGGLIGYVSTGTDADVAIDDVYANGNVSGRQYVGGAFGYLANGGGTATMAISDVQSHDSNSVTAAPTVTGSVNSVGGLVGRAESSTTSFLISDCESISGVTSAGGYAGGLIGWDRDNVDLTDCSASGSVTSVYGYVGGLTGGSDRPGRDFTNVEATGDVTATVSGVGVSNLFVGGLTGYARGSITQGRATGDVLISLAGGATVTNAYVGGLVGYGNATPVSESYAKGAVAFNTFGSGNQSFVGGLMGYSNGAISNSFATGDVDGGLYTGGLVGYLRSTVSNSFAAGDISGTYHVGGLIGDHDGAAGTINLAYAVGSLTRNAGTQTSRFGQLVGYCNGGVGDAKVTNSFYNTGTSIIDPVITTPWATCNTTTPARAITNAQMLSPGTGFAGFDFAGTGNDDWRYPTAFTKKGVATLYPYPILYWALP